MRTMLRLESYDVVTTLLAQHPCCALGCHFATSCCVVMLNDSLKYSLIVGGAGQIRQILQANKRRNPLLIYIGNGSVIAQSRHHLHTEKCANLNLALTVGIEICTF